MFKWYNHAEICYAYLSGLPAEFSLRGDNYEREPDVQLIDRLKYETFSACKWFTRGWTLQELLALSDVLFFGSDWSFLVSRSQAPRLLSSMTGVDIAMIQWPIMDAQGAEYVTLIPVVWDPDGALLRRSESLTTLQTHLSRYSIAQRMSWASSRSTSRLEDEAYSLLGIFDINMPMLYGEGRKAFTRLQEEIIRNSTDHSILAWNCLSGQHGDNTSISKRPPGFGYLLAPSPENFAGASTIVRLVPDAEEPFELTNRGLRTKLTVIDPPSHPGELKPIEPEMRAILNCAYSDNPAGPIAILITPDAGGRHCVTVRTHTHGGITYHDRVSVVAREEAEGSSGRLLSLVLSKKREPNLRALAQPETGFRIHVRHAEYFSYIVESVPEIYKQGGSAREWAAHLPFSPQHPNKCAIRLQVAFANSEHGSTRSLPTWDIIFGADTGEEQIPRELWQEKNSFVFAKRSSDGLTLEQTFDAVGPFAHHTFPKAERFAFGDGLILDAKVSNRGHYLWYLDISKH